MTHELPPARPTCGPAHWSRPNAPADAGPRAAKLWPGIGYWLRQLAALAGDPAGLAARILPRGRRTHIRAMLQQVERLVRCLVIEAAIRLAETLRPTSGRRDGPPLSRAPGTRPCGPLPEVQPPSPADPSAWRIGFCWTAPDGMTPRPRPKPRARVRPSITLLDDPLPAIFRRKPAPPPPPPPRPRLFSGRFAGAAPMNWPLFPDPAFHAHWAASGAARPRAAGAEPDLALAARLEILHRIAAAPQPFIDRLARRYARADSAARYALVCQPVMVGKEREGVRLDARIAREALIDAARELPGGMPPPPPVRINPG